MQGQLIITASKFFDDIPRESLTVDSDFVTEQMEESGMRRLQGIRGSFLH
jgi:hypothetical protein